MRVERQRNCAQSVRAAVTLRRVQQRLMAAMHAVVVSGRYHRRRSCAGALWFCCGAHG
jgi:hypothetical protein